MVQTQRAVPKVPAEQDTREHAERRLSVALRVVAGVLLATTAVYLLFPVFGIAADFFREPPFVTSSAGKVGLLALACLYAAGDVRRRRGLVVAVIVAHIVLVFAVLAMLAFADTDQEAGYGVSVKTVLLGALVFDGAIAIGLFALLKHAKLPPARREEDQPLTAVEQRVRTALIAAAIVFGLAAAACAAGLAFEKDFFRQLPLVANALVLVILLAMLCAYAATALRSNLAILAPIVAVHVLAAAASALYLLALDTGYTVPLLGADVSMTAILWAALAANAAIAAAVFALARSAWNARYKPAFFSWMQLRALVAVADVLVAGPDERVPPDEIAQNVDGHLSQLRAQRRWTYKLVLAAMQLRPLFELLPPLSEIESGARRAYLERRFKTPPRWPPLVKHLTQIMIRICQQLSFVGYYGDPRSYDSIGYEPFSRRARVRTLDIPEPGPHPLKVDQPETIGEKTITTDVCVIGSGAGGAIVAHELARLHPDRQILVLERGRYVEPRHFTEDEVGMIVQLYADGLMQQTDDWRFTVLQGSCVGGSTTVNNAVCFDPPGHVLARWNDEYDAGLDVDDLRASVKAVRSMLRVAPQTDAVLNPSGPRYLEGAKRLPEGMLETGVVEANIDGCFGSGYCNIGCKWGRKLSMLDTVLPAAQRESPDRVRIVSDCEVERIVTRGGEPKQVESLRAKLADGRELTVRARTYVVCAGSVASSYLLLRSGVGRGLPVGKGFSCNMGAPLTADFEGEPIRAYDGLQISHYGIPRRDGFVFETWFNPPVSQALNMPGWFEQHYANMKRYDHLMAVGVLVGTANNGRIGRALTGGPSVDFRPQPDDLATLARGLKVLGELLFEAGAARVMVNSWGYDEFTSPRELERVDHIAADPDYISLGTGHPQGGNAISRDPRRGVVGPDFRVHGHENLYVCDASVFPTSLTVNPQLTIMALAHYAARRIKV